MSRHVMREGRVVSIEEPPSPQIECFHKEDSRQTFDNKSESEYNGTTQTTGANSLSFFAASLHSTILEDTLLQLRYLEELNTKLRIIKTMIDLDLLRALKFGVQQPAVMDELQGVDPKNLKKEQYKLVKLANDRKMVCDTLLLLYTELGKNWKFTPLLDCLNKVRVLSEYREQLITDDAKLKISCKELSKQIRHQRNNIKSTYYDTDAIIEGLKSHVEDLVLEEECRCRYTVNWQNARREQHLEVIRRKEVQPFKALQRYKIRLDNEQRAHAEIEMLGIMQINEKAEEVENWMTKYDEDVEAIDLKIQIQKNKYNVAHEQRLELEQTLITHADLVKNWIKFTSEREAKRLYEEKMNRAAIVLQAWWRGLLVRKALGPYKVGKGRPAKKGKKK